MSTKDVPVKQSLSQSIPCSVPEYPPPWGTQGHAVENIQVNISL